MRRVFDGSVTAVHRLPEPTCAGRPCETRHSGLTSDAMVTKGAKKSPLDGGRKQMHNITSIGIALISVGLVALVVGYATRDKGYGPFLIGTGIACLLSLIVYHVETTLV